MTLFELIFLAQTILSGFSAPGGVTFAASAGDAPTDNFDAVAVYTAIYDDAGLYKPEPVGSPWVPGGGNTASGFSPELNQR